jgi:hypothetical protein
MTEDERPGDDHGHHELIAAFAALGGRLTGDELRRLVAHRDSVRTGRSPLDSVPLNRLATLRWRGCAGRPMP